MKYTVSCYKPVSDLKVNEGDEVRVVGMSRKNRITASSITNLSKKGSGCECERPQFMELIIEMPKAVDVSGVVNNVKRESSGIEFELTV